MRGDLLREKNRRIRYQQLFVEKSIDDVYNILSTFFLYRELETELLLAAKRASLAYGSTSSASERSSSQNSSDLS